ncbi:MAG: hypothetical protein HY788_03045 [Deltaproteobacteria bacterium]|nr:hypothetical protein [Deltaproteobacteria bacterium]
MELTAFNEDQLAIVHHAVEIAEEVTANHFRISTSEWKRMRYDIKTLQNLTQGEITNKAFAQLFKYSREPQVPPRPHRVLDFYLICLQDHKILEALLREAGVTLLCLCLYILTHELVHVVRFTKFFKRFDCTEAEREREESSVHSITYEILKGLSWPDMRTILESYTLFREVDRVVL